MQIGAETAGLMRGAAARVAGEFGAHVPDGVQTNFEIQKFYEPMFRRWLILILVSFLMSGTRIHADDKVFFREDFKSLDTWEHFFFRGVDRHTTYEIEKQGDSSVLAAKSSASASALVNQRTFEVAEYPIIRWRWKVDNLYVNGNYRQKSGDDFPMRVYVFFAYDPETAPIGMKIKYELARTLYGQYPPHSSLNYIWANHPHETEVVFNPFTERSVMIPLQHGPQKVGQWVDESVNVLQDYRRAFGDDPPLQASLAIMNDSDNTGESSTSYIQFIEVRKLP